MNYGNLVYCPKISRGGFLSSPVISGEDERFLIGVFDAARYDEEYYLKRGAVCIFFRKMNLQDLVPDVDTKGIAPQLMRPAPYLSGTVTEDGAFAVPRRDISVSTSYGVIGSVWGTGEAPSAEFAAIAEAGDGIEIIEPQSVSGEWEEADLGWEMCKVRIRECAFIAYTRTRDEDYLRDALTVSPGEVSYLHKMILEYFGRSHFGDEVFLRNGEYSVFFRTLDLCDIPETVDTEGLFRNLGRSTPYLVGTISRGDVFEIRSLDDDLERFYGMIRGIWEDVPYAGPGHWETSIGGQAVPVPDESAEWTESDEGWHCFIRRSGIRYADLVLAPREGEKCQMLTPLDPDLPSEVADALPGLYAESKVGDEAYVMCGDFRIFMKKVSVGGEVPAEGDSIPPEAARATECMAGTLARGSFVVPAQDRTVEAAQAWVSGVCPGGVPAGVFWKDLGEGYEILGADEFGDAWEEISAGCQVHLKPFVDPSAEKGFWAWLKKILNIG